MKTHWSIHIFIFVYPTLKSHKSYLSFDSNRLHNFVCRVKIPSKPMRTVCIQNLGFISLTLVLLEGRWFRSKLSGSYRNTTNSLAAWWVWNQRSRKNRHRLFVVRLNGGSCLWQQIFVFSNILISVIVKRWKVLPSFYDVLFVRCAVSLQNCLWFKEVISRKSAAHLMGRTNNGWFYSRHKQIADKILGVTKETVYAAFKMLNWMLIVWRCLLTRLSQHWCL